MRIKQTKDSEYYYKKADVCWIIAGIFFGITIVCKILVLILTIMGYSQGGL